MPGLGRIGLRTDSETKARLEEAAYVSRMSLNSFILDAADAEALRMLEAHSGTPAEVEDPAVVDTSSPQKSEEKVQDPTRLPAQWASWTVAQRKAWRKQNPR